MGRNVPGDQLDAVGSTIDGALFRELALQVTALCVAEIAGDLVEPTVDRFFVDVQLGHALFVEQRRHSLVLNGSLHGVRVNNGAELVGGLLVLEQRRAGEGDVCRLRQCLLHPLMGLAAVAAVSFVDQHDHVRRVIATLGQLGRRVELVDECEGDPLGPFADALGQVTTGQGAAALAILLRGDAGPEGPARHEVARELGFKIHAVGDHHDAALLEAFDQ